MKKYDLGLYEKSMPDTLSWSERLMAANIAGYDYLEISIDESEMRLMRLFDQEEINKIVDALKESPVKIRTMCLSGHRKYPLGSHDPVVREKSVEIFFKAVDLALQIDVRLIQLAGYDVYYESSDMTTRNYFLENLKKCINYASQKGVLCGFETMETAFMDTTYKAKEYCDVIKSPYLGIYPDLGNLTNASIKYEHDLYEDINLGVSRTFAAHLKETLPDLYRNIEFGEGHVNFEKGVQHYWNLGVRQYTCEFWNQEHTDYRERLRHNANFVREVIERVARSLDNEN